MDAVSREAPGALGIAARGFKDTTRIAAGDPQMWQEIFLTNRPALTRAIDAFRRALDDLDGLVQRGDPAGLETALARIKAAREAVL
jgi:prephenate dehydrogenase